jgi:exopolyphosphatase/guanosine-5'-triphosphate,3'-diphosphate pyrophosphatase
MMSGTRRVAAIDCGTNSLRLLIADIDPAERTLVDVERRMEIVRLGQGVDATGKLAPEALARTFRVLREYTKSIQAAGVTATRMVATSATRDASNADEFVRGVVDILGTSPEVITGEQEAYLSFIGATGELAATGAKPAGAGGAGSGAGQERPQPPYLVVDIGGGSTEFVLGGDLAGQAGPAAPGPAAVSMDIGSVRLTERYLRSDPPTAAEVRAATADIDAAIGTAAGAVPAAAARTLVGVAGSVTTLTAIALELSGYDPSRTHHAWLTAGRVHEVTSSLLGQTREQRAAIPSLHPGRVDVIGAGALVLDRVMTRLGFAEMVTSEHDILDGIAFSIATGER